MYFLQFFSTLLVFNRLSEAILPTNYEYFNATNFTTIASGISMNETNFFLNGIPFYIYSGSMHYFRIPRAYWNLRLQQIRSAGLNTVETYIPWNLHEPHSGIYDFGEGGSQMEDFLHLGEFLETAQEQDLFVILRPGPYISAEYNFGGFPSWLLREAPMGLRSDEENYIKYVSRYFNVLLPILEKYQFTRGGPVIAFQVENEYGYTGYKDFSPSKNYLEILRQLYLNNSIVELLMTSDNPIASGDEGTLPGVLFQTTNFGDSPEKYLEKLAELQPNKPLMVMEFWMGWFDHWTDKHQTRNSTQMAEIYEAILKHNASVNIYMFHGGSNFAFGNGAHLNNELLDNSAFLPTTTSYDYDAPLNEAGQYTSKYYSIQKLMKKHNPMKTLTPSPPIIPVMYAYPPITFTKQIKLSDVIADQAPTVLQSENLIPMELLDINNKSGQSYGYIVYRKEKVNLGAKSVLKIQGHVCDTVMVLVNGRLASPKFENSQDLDGFGYWRLKDSNLVINNNAVKSATIDIVVEEWGRMHGGTILQYNQTFKGLWQGNVTINDKPLTGWKIIPLEFKTEWNNNLTSWKPKFSNDGPSFYLANLFIDYQPADTYLDMSDYSKGLIIVNGFPLGKYFKYGPQQSVYLPAAFLKRGNNSIMILEHFRGHDQLPFVTDLIYTTM